MPIYCMDHPHRRPPSHRILGGIRMTRVTLNQELKSIMTEKLQPGDSQGMCVILSYGRVTSAAEIYFCFINKGL